MCSLVELEVVVDVEVDEEVVVLDAVGSEVEEGTGDEEDVCVEVTDDEEEVLVELEELDEVVLRTHVGSLLLQVPLMRQVIELLPCRV